MIFKTCLNEWTSAFVMLNWARQLPFYAVVDLIIDKRAIPLLMEISFIYQRQPGDAGNVIRPDHFTAFIKCMYPALCKNGGYELRAGEGIGSLKFYPKDNADAPEEIIFIPQRIFLKLQDYFPDVFML